MYITYRIVVKNTRTIPLAGVIALLLIIVIFVSKLMDINQYDDHWVSDFLYQRLM
jgi:hypothetical protein